MADTGRVAFLARQIEASNQFPNSPGGICRHRDNCRRHLCSMSTRRLLNAIHMIGTAVLQLPTPAASDLHEDIRQSLCFNGLTCVETVGSAHHN
jgi:hypothetical protein